MVKRQISVEVVATKILFIRGKKVMLDSDLAKLYRVMTRDLNKAVKRNLERFPSDFMFQLNKKEAEDLMFQIGTSSWEKGSLLVSGKYCILNRASAHFFS